MDFMEGGSLTDTLGTTVDFKEMYIAYVCREILLALAFMHSQFRLHRDIKSDNVLVSVESVLWYCIDECKCGWRRGPTTIAGIGDDPHVWNADSFERV